MSRRCPGDVPEVSQRCRGGFPDVPHMWLVSNSEVSCFLLFFFFCFFFIFSRFWSNFLVLCVCVFFFLGGGGSSVLALKKFVAFNSVCKNPFVLFVQSVPNIFCFTVVLCCFSLLGKDGDLNFQGFKFSRRNCFENPSRGQHFGFFFSQICADKCHEMFVCIPQTKCHTKGQHKNRRHCRPDRACKLHS